MTREIALLCAAALLYAMAALWLAVATRVVLLALLASLLARFLSGVIVDPRPYLVVYARPLLPLARDTGFPSDHALLAATLTVSLWWIDRHCIPAFAAGTIFVLLGRLAVGAHHTLDVVGSVAIVTVVAWVVDALPVPPRWERPVLALVHRQMPNAVNRWRSAVSSCVRAGGRVRCTKKEYEGVFGMVVTRRQ